MKVANIKYSNKEIKWESDIKELFTHNLDKEKEPSLNYSAVLGMYLPQVMYLDKEWVVQNLDKIFDEKLEKYWEAAMESYLGYSRFYLDIYKLMKEHSNYEKVLNVKFNHKDIYEKIVEHICVAYLNGEEFLEEKESLIVKLIDKQEIKNVQHIIWFISTLKNEYLDNNIKLRIKELWGKLIGVLENNSEKDESQKLLYKLCEWINLVQRLDDDVTNWVEKYIKYCRYNYETYWIMKGLLKHVMLEPAKVATIYMHMIDNEIYPDDEENIRIIVKRLYEKGIKKQADQICNSYLGVGIKFLMDIYDEFNIKSNE